MPSPQRSSTIFHLSPTGDCHGEVTLPKNRLQKEAGRGTINTMTPTEKKYTKNVGKLFLVKDKRYNSDKKKFEVWHDLCMVYGMHRTGYTKETGPYAYSINTLNHVENDWYKDYNIRCAEFVNGPRRRSYWGNRTYELLTKENMELVGKVIDLKDNE